MFVYLILGSATIICLILFIYIVINLIRDDLQATIISRQRTRRNRLARTRSFQTRLELILELTEQRRVQPVREIEMTPVDHIVVLNPGNHQMQLGTEYVYNKEG
tara:strand:- start:419 stop:730 length:312 start_codon:yes stop_codon:yes gene_type:complete